jgi:hypothetical protein
VRLIKKKIKKNKIKKKKREEEEGERERERFVSKSFKSFKWKLPQGNPMVYAGEDLVLALRRQK